MLSGLKRLVGSISVKEERDHITIDGIPADVMANDIYRIWRTSRINANMFTRATNNTLVFPSFFAIDILYMLEQMIEFGNRRVSARTLTKIRDLLLKETWLANTLLEHKPRVNLSLLRNLIYTPKDYQQRFFETYDELTQKFSLKGFLLAAAAGSGKAQPLDAKIKVPGGWSTMGEMIVGSLVIAADGTTTRVTGVYPQGKKIIFKITFADGRSTRACQEHLWRIYDRACYRNQAGGWSTVNTFELMRLLAKKNSMIYVPLNHSEVSNDLPLPMDPYTLGVILGDGGISSNCITINTPDQEIFDRITPTLPSTLSFIKRDDVTQGLISKRGHVNEYINILRTLGLMGLGSKEKYIPTPYLHSSTDQRQAIVQGLMDTDGYVDSQGTVNYSSSSYQLALDVQYLVRSLGGIAKITSREPTYSYKGETRTGATSYTVNIRHPTPSILFSLPRKKERTNDDGQYCSSLRLRVTGIEPTGTEEAQCISIEHPDHLYVTDDFIVTHNTYIALALAEMLSKKKVIITCPKNATERVWMSEIKTLFRKPQTYWIAQHGNPYKGERFLVFHYEALNQAFEITKNFDPDDVMVILDESHNLNEETSLRTQLFVKLVRKLGTRDILPMSGTPIKALGSESIPLLQMIDPLFTDDARVRFKKIFGRDGNRGLDILKERLGLLSYKVEKSELGLDKPVMTPLPVTIPNGRDFTLVSIKKDMVAFIEQRYAYYKEHAKAHKALYDACMETHEASLKTPAQRQALGQYRRYVTLIQRYKGDARQVGEEIKWANTYEKNVILPTLSREDAKVFKDVKSIIKYVNLKIQGEALGRVLGRKRQECHVAMVAHIDFKGVIESTQKKTVVFTSFVPALERAQEHLTSIGFKSLVVYGKTNSDLNRLVQQFEKDEDLNPLCATYQSLSTAVPLVMADTMIMIDSPFRSYIHEQAVSRIHRLGATTQTRVWECRLDTGTEPNISTRSADILEWSQQQVSAIMGIESPFVIENVKDGVTIGNEAYGLDESFFMEMALREELTTPALQATLMW